jgi:hypothetical protein
MKGTRAASPMSKKQKTPDFAVSAEKGEGMAPNAKSAKKSARAKGKVPREVGVSSNLHPQPYSRREGDPPAFSRGAKPCPATGEGGGGT